MSSKFVVKVESSLEQQENLRNSRKSLKVLQRASTDKENLVGRQIYGSQKAFVKSKSENDFNDTASDIKRKKLASQPDRAPSSTSSSSSAASCSGGTAPPAATATVRGRRSSELLRITEEDLQAPTDATVSEGYWRELAEKRRLALDATLTENQELHEINASLKEELDVSNAMLDETRNLVEILTEMLEEGEAAGTEKAAAAAADDDGFEQGESSRSFLHASLAEEAAEEGGVAVVAHSEDDAEVAASGSKDEQKQAAERDDGDEAMKLAPTKKAAVAVVEEQVDADDEASRGSLSSQSSQSSHSSSNNSNSNTNKTMQTKQDDALESEH